MSKTIVLPTEYTVEYEVLATKVMELREDLVRHKNGNFVAGKRARKKLRALKRYIQEIINESIKTSKSNTARD